MKKLHKSALMALALAVLGLAAVSEFKPVSADNVDMQVYPSNARLSFRGKTVANTEGSTVALINTKYNYADDRYSTSSATLHTGDELLFKVDDTKFQRNSVGFTSSQLRDDQIALVTAMSSDVAPAGTTVIATMSGQIKFTFNAKAGTSWFDIDHDGQPDESGYFELLIPSIADTLGGGTVRPTTDSEGNIVTPAQYLLSADGVPDAGGFDFGNGTKAAHVVTYTIGSGSTTNLQTRCSATSAAANATLIDDVPYHTVKCTYNKAEVSDGTEINIVVEGFINPAPYEISESNVVKNAGTTAPDGYVASGRTMGSMDIYEVKMRQMDQVPSGSVAKIDELRNARTYVGFSNGVKMTVHVMPQLTFKISGIAAGQTACGGVETTVGTDALNVDFGSISNTYFTDAAQHFTVVTNAPHGYVITAITDDQMRLKGESCPSHGFGYSYCIPGYGITASSTDSQTTEGTWDIGAGKDGFGYTLKVVSGDDYLNTTPGQPNVAAAFEYDGWRAFADRAAGDDPVQIFNNLRSTNTDELDVCYRVMSSPTNIPGDYMTALTYTITASF